MQLTSLPKEKNINMSKKKKAKDSIKQEAKKIEKQEEKQLSSDELLAKVVVDEATILDSAEPTCIRVAPEIPDQPAGA